MGVGNSTLHSADLSSLSKFAIKAVEQLHKDAEAVSAEEGTKAFVNSFKTELAFVGESLLQRASLLDAGHASDQALCS